MRGRVCWGAAVVLLFVQCVGLSPHQTRIPTPERPVSACYISCSAGYLFRPQHLCKGDRRRFLDIPLIGENVTRGVDGTILSSLWIACTGQWRPDGFCSESADYPKIDVEFGTCDSVIRGIVSSRAVSERGVHPGERDFGKEPPQ